MLNQTLFDDQGNPISRPLESDLRRKQIRALAGNVLPPHVRVDRRKPQPMSRATKLKLIAGGLASFAAGVFVGGVVFFFGG